MQSAKIQNPSIHNIVGCLDDEIWWSLICMKSQKFQTFVKVPWPSWLRRGANKYNLLRQDQQFDPARDHLFLHFIFV